MLQAPIPENDEERIASLEKMHILATPREVDIDRVARMARRIFGSDIALVTLIDREGTVEELPLLPKYDVAHRILDRVVAILQSQD